MGNFYTNITTRNISAQDMLGFLKKQNLTAYLILGPQDYCTVYEQICDEQDTRHISKLLREISKTFSHPAIGFINHDDDVLQYELWNEGKKIDEYCSSPGFFEPETESNTPVGGKAGVLALLLGRVGADEGAIEKILRASSDDEAYTFAIDRHRALAEALGLPLHSVGFGFQYLSEGELPEGISPEKILKT